MQHGAEVHVLNCVESGPKPALVKELGAIYHTGSIADIGLRPDILLECTGAGGLVQQSIASVSPGGIVCLTGVGPAGAVAGSAAALATEAVLKNLVVVGSVNANRRYYYRAVKALAAADRGWLAQLVTRQVGLGSYFPDAVARMRELDFPIERRRQRRGRTLPAGA